MAVINVNLGTAPLGTVSYTIRWRPLGSTTWNTGSTAPANPLLATTTTVAITVPNENTIYEIQLIGNCGATSSNSTIYRQIERTCPTALNITQTDSTINLDFPLNTLAPISTHIASIIVRLLQGVTVISTQTITPNSLNNLTFTGLTASTIYTLEYTVNFTQTDSFGGTNTMVCTTNVTTLSTPTCLTPVILNITN